ncbi:hypothetical protein [Halostagnicola sp. A-GB9-2]|uniref:hypothetical protein n=1 Tax=Halostagnicola sp. A-GB9-2 TaxID=3048066 RepID=UPI0024C09134|nr:hypothetical protein [Halostagnicola sp. A-GB9-2]MDJ1433565.1 hypothetical protein [Halostagnicola sp. A-GB9-2]
MTSPLPIVYIRTSNTQGIRGSIRLQKLVFLGQQESNIPEKYRFIPYKFGPYSYQLQRDIESLIDRDYISRNTTRNNSGNYRTDYSLTPSGIRAAKALLKKDGFDKIFEEANKVTSRYGEERLSDLISYVYGNYTEYTDQSTLDIERILDEATTSQFTEQDPSQVGPFNQIKKLSEEEGEIAGIGKDFIRQSIEIGSGFRATLERISGDSVSIYWRSPSPSFDSFTQVIQNDTMVPEDALSEMRVRDSEGWIRGECNELLNRVKSDTCLFLRTEAEDSQYTVTWEAGRETSGDEITIYMTESQADYKELRAALVQYATATALDREMAPKSQVGTTDDMVSESLRQTAKLAIS